MSETLAVAVGGALGSVARYWIGTLSAAWLGEAFPYGTVFINVTGSFVIGLFATLSGPGGALPAGVHWRLFVLIGLCGGYTTFSSFSLQTLVLARNGALLAACANIVASVALCLLGVTAGFMLAEQLGPVLR